VRIIKDDFAMVARGLLPHVCVSPHRAPGEGGGSAGGDAGIAVEKVRGELNEESNAKESGLGRGSEGLDGGA